jgi:preprotein translocase subunit SecF
LQEKFGSINEVRFDSIGPVIGKELQRKAVIAIILVLAGIIVYLAYAFRKITGGLVSSWAFGVNAILALIHDVLITIGFFAILGYFFKVEIDTLFVTALLTVIGFSVHDTIVVFDRIREGLKKHYGEVFENIVNNSINETIVRSINTSFTTLLVLVALYIFGGETIRYFALALIFGIIVGTYSSIFVASPLLLIWYNIRRKRA